MFVRICKGCFIKTSLIRSIDIMKAEDFDDIDLYNFEDETHVAVIHLMGNEENFVYGINEKEAIGLENQLTALCSTEPKPAFLTDYVIGPWEDDNA